MPRAVVLAGGWAHPGEDLIAAMQTLVEARGFAVRVVTNPAEAPEAIAGGCDLLVVGCCWFAMEDERYNDAQRQEHAVNFDGALRSALTMLIEDGVPVLALHTAVISFDGADPWAERLGGSWNWATSWHPDPALITVRPAPASPIDFEAFSVVDELYQGLDVLGGTMPVAESESGDPLVWLHRSSSGKAAVNLLGHDRRSLADPAHCALNERLLDWLLTT